MGKRTVTVNGAGRAAVSPDVVRLDLRVGHDADDVAAALAGAAEGITKVRSMKFTLAWLRDPNFAGNVEKSMKWLCETCKAGRWKVRRTD